LPFACTIEDSISVAGNVTLTSTVEEDGRQFACEGEVVIFTCQVIGSLVSQPWCTKD